MREILEKEAQATGLDHGYESFTYPVYDDPCRAAVYFSPKFTDPDETELMREAEAHNVTRVQDLLKDASVANLRDQYGRTALIHATIRSQSKSTVAALLAFGADPNVPDSHGDTA
jgi:ankyrin repeat protein